jgi:hypothetical protein
LIRLEQTNDSSKQTQEARKAQAFV